MRKSPTSFFYFSMKDTFLGDSPCQIETPRRGMSKPFYLSLLIEFFQSFIDSNPKPFSEICTYRFSKEKAHSDEWAFLCHIFGSIKTSFLSLWECSSRINRSVALGTSEALSLAECILGFLVIGIQTQDLTEVKTDFLPVLSRDQESGHVEVGCNAVGRYT